MRRDLFRSGDGRGPGLTGRRVRGRDGLRPGPRNRRIRSMPLAAINTGQVDAVLSPEGIAREMLKLQGIGEPLSAAGIRSRRRIRRLLPILLRRRAPASTTTRKAWSAAGSRGACTFTGVASVKDYLDLSRPERSRGGPPRPPIS